MGGILRIGRSGLLLGAVLVCAAAVRLYGLSWLPPAHYRDVALTALDAMRAASGHPRLHYTYDEGLYSNLMGLGFVLFGPSDWSVRLPGALIGVLTCWGVYRLGKSLRHRRAGLYGAALLGASFWHLLLSRSGFRAILLPLLLALSIALLVEGLRGRSVARMAAAGALLGLGVHVYPAVRFAPFILPIYLLAELGHDREAWRRAAKGLAAFLGAALLVALPMLVHYLHRPEHFTLPHRVVSVFSPKLAPGQAGLNLRRNVPATLLMLHWSGDRNWRHNIAGAPMLDPISGLLMLIGAVAALRGPPPSAALLLAWVPIMLLPSYLSVEGVPHALRSCGALPAVALLAGFGLAAVEDLSARRAGERFAAAGALALLVGLGIWTSYRYFIVWGRDPRVAQAHDFAFRAAARVLASAPRGVGKFVVANGEGFRAYGWPAEVHPYLFELRDERATILGPHDSSRLVLRGRPALVALVRRDEAVLETIRRLNPGAMIREVRAPGLSVDSPVYRIN
ncbi:MAG: ArnT family glycosyltransferase [Acidobacteriota bacterium]